MGSRFEIRCPHCDELIPQKVIVETSKVKAQKSRPAPGTFESSVKMASPEVRSGLWGSLWDTFVRGRDPLARVSRMAKVLPVILHITPQRQRLYDAPLSVEEAGAIGREIVLGPWSWNRRTLADRCGVSEHRYQGVYTSLLVEGLLEGQGNGYRLTPDGERLFAHYTTDRPSAFYSLE